MFALDWLVGVVLFTPKALLKLEITKDNCLKRYMAAKILKRVPDITTPSKQNGSLSKPRFHLM